MSGTSLLERLRARQWRITPQRRVIAQALEGDHVHLTAEEVLGIARGGLPEVSLATVYNTLNELVTMGEVQQVDAGPGPARYDPNVEQPHHHLVCLRCGELRDVYPVGEGRIELPRSQRFGYELVSREVLFQGYCPRCISTAR
jgi:Fur family transcriptional regulator, stress-responsive regulator